MQKHAVTALGGVLSGFAAWGGSELLPEWRWLQDIYPGLVFGAFLFVLHGRDKEQTFAAALLALFICLLSSVASWRLAVEIYPYRAPLPFALSGLVGGLVVGAGCLGLWQSKSFAALGLIAASGLLGGLIFQAADRFLYDFGESIWVLILLIEWQTLVLVAVGLARERYGSGPVS